MKTPVTDIKVEKIDEAKSYSSLKLTDSPVTSVSVETINQLESLKMVQVAKTKQFNPTTLCPLQPTVFRQIYQISS
jgi:hypothetical protein